ncbi:Germ cell-less protein-like 1 [Clonorchis sinensis]|uniref:Germ cell-less protein-like 1 n=1 Tax=Clonorchis sinensis TaxID=79923 RepID=A0A8T1MAB0_CLOSI|nr:Germ cell-less protein-like 1 [Clonorchis sinensis]
MGGYFSSVSSKPQSKTRKRPILEAADDDLPIKKRIRSTYNYVYRELFCKGEGSDLTVKSLNEEWHLHRLYVKQSPFFSAMLDGGWKESGCSVIELELSDPNITKSSLNTVFGAFYRDTILLSETTVLGVLASATWFHMDDIRSLCSDFMERRICMRNVVDFFQISKQYNLPHLLKRTVKWLADNLLIMSDCASTYDFLRKIPVELMQDVIATPDLIVVQLEQDVFLLLLKWVFLRQHADYQYQPNSPLLEAAYTYFTSEDTTFLETPEGAVYAPAFRSVRWEYVVNVYKTTERMIRDHIVPESWLSQVFSRQWLRLLRMHDQQTSQSRLGSYTRSHNNTSSTSTVGGTHSSPARIRTTLTARESSPVTDMMGGEDSPNSLSAPDDLSDDVFWLTSERCGRRIDNGDMTYSWRWTGFHFGLDVVVKYKRRTFSIIRFTDHNSAEGAVSHSPRLRLLIAVRVKSIVPNSNAHSLESVDQDVLIDAVSEAHNDKQTYTDDGKQLLHVSTSGVLSLSLEENVPHEVLRVPDEFTFPAVVSANILRYDPILCDLACLNQIST